MLEHMVLSTGKHGRVARGVALASDMTMREGRRCQRVGVVAKFFFFFFSQLAPMRCKLQPIHADSGRIGRNLPIQVKIQKKKKKPFSQSAVISISILIFSSLSLSGLCAPRHGSLASALCLPFLTQYHS